MDVGNGVLQFERTILSASVKPLQPQQISSTDQYELFVFEIKGLAFLYHQVQRDSVPRNSSSSFQAVILTYYALVCLSEILSNKETG